MDLVWVCTTVSEGRISTLEYTLVQEDTDPDTEDGTAAISVAGATGHRIDLPMEAGMVAEDRW